MNDNPMVEAFRPDDGEAHLPLPQPDPLVSMIERLAIDPRVDVDKLERILAMQERVLERGAKTAYTRALAEMQPKLPTVDRKGRIIVYSKADRDYAAKNGGEYPSSATPQQSTPYALFEDINEAIRPVLAKHWFALSFRIGTAGDGKLTVTGILAHRDGHSEETTIPLMHDTSGSKNSVQAIGSSVSYGKRYTAMALLNITSRAPQDADDDGVKGGAPETIDADQVTYLEQQIRDTASDTAIFLKTIRAATIETMTVAQYQQALGLIARKKKAMGL